MWTKIVIDGYIILVSHNGIGTPITEQEYNSIIEKIDNKPATAPDGYGYRLRTDLTWELYELPQQTEDEQKHGYTEADLAAMTNAELERILATYGLTATANKQNMIRLILYMQGGDAE